MIPQHWGDFFLILAQSADMSSNNQNVPQDITASVENRYNYTVVFYFSLKNFTVSELKPEYFASCRNYINNYSFDAVFF